MDVSPQDDEILDEKEIEKALKGVKLSGKTTENCPITKIVAVFIHCNIWETETMNSVSLLIITKLLSELCELTSHCYA